MTRTVLALAALATVILALPGCGRGYDPYDDSIRGTHELPRRLAFGQRIGADGDGCWPENDRDRSGRVFCDLVSLGGLHWDTGDVKVAHRDVLIVGSGFVCLLDEDSVPWCWEWSQEVQPPRAARVPQDALFGRLIGGSGFVCAQTPEHQQVTCWSIGTDQPRFRQATHYFSDHTDGDVVWHLYRVSTEPRGFLAWRRESGSSLSSPAVFDPFTGAQLSGEFAGTRLLVTETVP